MSENRDKRPPGAAPDVLKIDVPFEEAMRRLVTTPVPPEGLPDFRIRERERKRERGQ